MPDQTTVIDLGKDMLPWNDAEHTASCPKPTHITAVFGVYDEYGMRHANRWVNSCMEAPDATLTDVLAALAPGWPGRRLAGWLVPLGTPGYPPESLSRGPDPDAIHNP